MDVDSVEFIRIGKSSSDNDTSDQLRLFKVSSNERPACSNMPGNEKANEFVQNLPSTSNYSSDDFFDQTQSPQHNDLIANENTFDIQEQQQIINDLRQRGREIDTDTAADNEESTDTYTDSSENIILSVFWRLGELGAAYIDTDTLQLNILRKTIDIGPMFQTLRNLYRQVQPLYVITGSFLSDKFINTLRILTTPEQSTEEQSDVGSSPTTVAAPNTVQLCFVGNKEYNFDACYQRVLSLDLASCPRDADAAERSAFLHSALPLEWQQTCHALGALLKYLDTNMIHLTSKTQGVSMFNSVQTISLDGQLMIDSDTLSAIQVFSEIPHPSKYKMGVRGTGREGLSIYGLFNRCRSRIGTIFMKTILQQPTRNMKVLNDRFDMISWCMNPLNIELISALGTNLAAITNTDALITKIKLMTATSREWKSLSKTIHHSIVVTDLCSGAVKAKGCPKLLQKIVQLVDPDSMLNEVAVTLHNVLDLEEMERSNTFVVKPGVRKDIDQLKQMMSSITDLITNIAGDELDTLPDYITDCVILYMPTIGYVMGVNRWDEGTPPQQLERDDCRFMFTTGNRMHFKTTRCLELDAQFGDIQMEIVQKEKQVNIQLVQYLQDRLEPLHAITKYCAELDCMIALAKVAIDNSYVRPEITTERVLEIKEGRHPLVEMVIGQFTPNDTLLSGVGGLMKVISGPNACGKSVYLKQVALIAYLAHVGSFVPATSARIGMLQHIHSRIQSTESVNTRASGFLIDLRQMSLSVRCPDRSLLLVDEFGRGTTSDEGEALLGSCLQHLLDRGELCPFTLVSTHFHPVLDWLKPSPYLRRQTFDYLMENGSLVFLYKIIDGKTTESFALEIARGAGVSDKTVQRASAILKMIREKKPIEADSQRKIQQTYATEAVNIVKRWKNRNGEENQSVQTREEISEESQDREESSDESQNREESSKASQDREESSKASQDREESSKASQDREESSDESQNRDESSKENQDREESSEESQDREESSEESPPKLVTIN